MLLACQTDSLRKWMYVYIRAFGRLVSWPADWSVTSTQFKIYTWMHRFDRTTTDFITLSSVLIEYFYPRNMNTFQNLKSNSYNTHSNRTHFRLIKQTEWKFVRIVFLHAYIYINKMFKWTLAAIMYSQMYSDIFHGEYTLTEHRWINHRFCSIHDCYRYDPHKPALFTILMKSLCSFQSEEKKYQRNNFQRIDIVINALKTG